MSKKILIPVVCFIAGLATGLFMHWQVFRFGGTSVESIFDDIASGDVETSMRAQCSLIKSHKDVIIGLKNKIAMEGNLHTLSLYIDLLYDIAPIDAVESVKQRRILMQNVSDLDRRLPEQLLLQITSGR